MTKIGRPSTLAPGILKELQVEFNNPYWGQCRALAHKYGVKESLIRKLKSRYVKERNAQSM